MNRHQRRVSGKKGKVGATVADARAAAFRLALSHASTGRFREAEDACRLLVTEFPDDENGLLLLGTILLETGRPPQALEFLARVKPGRDPYRHFLHAKALLLSGRIAEAADGYGQAVALKPDYAEALAGRGVALVALKRHHEAVADFTRALEIDPATVQALSGLAHALVHLGRTAEAAEAYRRAVAVMPNSADVHARLAAILVDLDRGEEALSHAERAMELAPQSEAALRVRAHALVSLGRLEPALDSFGRLLATNPAEAEAHLDMAAVHRFAGRFEQAAEAIRAGLVCDPGSARAHGILGQILIAQGHDAEGWAELRQLGGLALEPLPPSLTGETVAIESLASLGNALFALRYVSALKQRGAAVVMRAPPVAAALLARVPGVDRVASPDETAAGRTVGPLDLPWLLGVTDPVPPAVLEPLPASLDQVRERLGGDGSPLIGVAWRAGKPFAYARYAKAVDPRALGAALRPLDARVVVVQRGPDAEELARFTEALGRPPLDLSAVNDDLEAMLALLTLLDGMVSVPSAAVHLRAAAGRPAQVLVPSPPEFRWMAAGDRSPWFPGMTVHRQTVDGSWDEALRSLSVP